MYFEENNRIWFMRFFLFINVFLQKNRAKKNYIFTREKDFFSVKIQLKLEITHSPATKYIFYKKFMHFVTCFSRKQLHFRQHGAIPTVWLNNKLQSWRTARQDLREVFQNV